MLIGVIRLFIIFNPEPDRSVAPYVERLLRRRRPRNVVQHHLHRRIQGGHPSAQGPARWNADAIRQRLQARYAQRHPDPTSS